MSLKEGQDKPYLGQLAMQICTVGVIKWQRISFKKQSRTGCTEFQEFLPTLALFIIEKSTSTIYGTMYTHYKE